MMQSTPRSKVNELLSSANLVFLLVLLMSANITYSQDVENSIRTLRERLKNDPITFHGNLSAQFEWNSISGHALRRRDPFNMGIFGHASVDILGVHAPFSLAISDGNSTYNLPSYTFVGLSPSYRWAKLHLFRRNMNFSKYTLANHGFNGVGIELRPGKWRVAAMHGTLRRAQIEDYGFRQELDAHHHRTGQGIKIGYESGKDQVHFIAFRARDREDVTSATDTSLPQAVDNLLISTIIKKRISPVLDIQGEIAHSVYTPDKNFLSRKNNGIDEFFQSFIKINGSTSRSSAYNFDINFYPGTIGDFSIGYERINPDFNSLGTLYFQNDFEHFTARYRGKIADKIGITSRIGLERNNLDELEIESRNRFIGAFQINLPAGTKWNNSLGYSNFRQTIRLLDNTDPLQLVDSIFLGSTNHQLNMQSSYQFDDKNIISGFFSHQRANVIQQEHITTNATSITNAGVSYAQTGQKNTTWTAALFYNSLSQDIIKSSALSTTLGVRQELNKDWHASLRLMSQSTFLNSAANGHILRVLLQSNFSLSTQQKLQLRLQWISRNRSRNDLTELMGHLGYQFQF